MTDQTLTNIFTIDVVSMPHESFKRYYPLCDGVNINCIENIELNIYTHVSKCFVGDVERPKGIRIFTDTKSRKGYNKDTNNKIYTKSKEESKKLLLCIQKHLYLCADDYIEESIDIDIISFLDCFTSDI